MSATWSALKWHKWPNSQVQFKWPRAQIFINYLSSPSSHVPKCSWSVQVPCNCPSSSSVIVPKWPSALSAQVAKCSSTSSTQVSKCIKCPSSELPQVPSSSQVSEYLTDLSAQVPFNSPQVIQSPSSILSAKTPYISKYHSLTQLFLVFQVP